MNFFIIFKNTLSIWLLPVFLVSLFLNNFDSFTNFNSYILLCYLIIFALYYFSKKKIFFYTDRIFFLYFSLVVFANNNIPPTKYLNFILLIILFILCFYIFMFFYFKKAKRTFQLNFEKLSCVIELLFILSVFLFGAYSNITITILFTASTDIIYKILILTTIGHLKKIFKN
mgnify:CR=1 FL=1